MALRYSVPFNHKKHKEASDYDVKPLVLPSIGNDECDGDGDNDVKSSKFNEKDEEQASGETDVDGAASEFFYLATSCVVCVMCSACVHACMCFCLWGISPAPS